MLEVPFRILFLKLLVSSMVRDSDEDTNEQFRICFEGKLRFLSKNRYFKNLNFLNKKCGKIQNKF
jgi:hypothetical protein